MPKVLNAKFSGENRPTPGSIIHYACNEGYFAYGPNVDNNQTKCLSNRSYSLEAEQLFQCVSIGLFSFFLKNSSVLLF